MHQILVSHCQSTSPPIHNFWDEADYELLGALTAVLGAMRAHSSTERPASVADTRQKMQFLMEDMKRLAMTGRLDEFSDVIVNRRATVDQPDRTVC